MTPRQLSQLTNGFVALYALDAGLSLLDELLRASTASDLLVVPRMLVAGLVLAASLILLVALALTPRLPATVVLPLGLSAFWLNFGAAPMPLWIERPLALGLALAIFQIGVCVAVLLRMRQLEGEQSWWLRAGRFEGPGFSLGHSLLAALVAVVVLMPAGLGYLLLVLAMWIEQSTQGFVSFDLSGVSLADRHYARAQSQVRLVGMMHVGEEAAYRELVASFVAPSTVVLAEGVTDDRGLLEEPLSYGDAARAIGLDHQDDIESYLAESRAGETPEWPVVRHADVDMSSFDPQTVEWLSWTAAIWSSNTPLEALMELRERLAVDSEVLVVVMRDILDRRNAHLLSEIDSALGEFERVVVPWGALHLPVIESSLIEQGFEQTGGRLRRLISWRTITRAVLDPSQGAGA